MLPLLTVNNGLCGYDFCVCGQSADRWGNVEINSTQYLFKQQASLLILVDYCRYQQSKAMIGWSILWSKGE